jgi:hypothetical protein
MARGPRQAHLDGFDLHANAWVPPDDRARLERLCRYLLRPPLAQDRLRLRADGRVLVRLKQAWRDGTTRLAFEPLEFLAKLAALPPRPAINLLLYSRSSGGERSSPAHAGSRRVGTPSKQRHSQSGQVNTRVHPPIEPARGVSRIIAPRTASEC